MARVGRRAVLLGVLLAVALFVVAAPAQGAPVTTGREAQDRLFFLVFILALIIGGIVEALLIVAVLRYRRREGFRLPTKVKTHDARLEFIWTILPIFVVAAVAGGSFYTFQITENPPEGTVHVDVFAQRFAWSFVYPDGNESQSLLRVQVNEVVRLNVTSQDVIHSYFIPEFGLKIDAIPGRINHYWFQALEVGTYHIECAEFCGVGHYSMVGSLEVFAEGSQALPYGPAT